MTAIKLAYNIEEAQVATSLGRSVVYQLITNGVLKAMKAGRRTLIRADSLEAYINSLPDSRIGEGRGKEQKAPR